jgi:protein-S-isoprenylcysteine O-methyltransferase Ste14
MKKVLVLFYGIVSYVLFLVALVGLIAFLGHLGLERVIDSGPASPLPEALAVNGALILLFGVQHSVMARPGFKQIWTRIVPQPVERSTFVLLSSLSLLLLIWQWRAMPQTIFDLRQTVPGILLEGLFWFGLLLIVVVSFLLNHADLFGLRQVYLAMREEGYRPVGFRQHALFRLVRHPMATGTALIFWATPHMTLGHLFLALGMTAYILVGTSLEERDLIDRIGEAYLQYRKRTPAFLPRVLP